jgi:hypothetical protein
MSKVQAELWHNFGATRSTQNCDRVSPAFGRDALCRVLNQD